MVSGQNADNIIGQPTYAGTSTASTQNGLSGPIGLAFEGTNRRLFVTDSSNNRLNIYDGSGSNITPSGGGAVVPSSYFYYFGW
jgi:DNA-binding beta-propeller fold protein YncE